MHDPVSRNARGENLNSKRHARHFPDGVSSEQSKNTKKRPLVFKENTTPLNPTLSDFNRYSFPLSACSPSGKPSRTFSDALNESINLQRQEKRAVSLMPEILLHSAVLDNNVEDILKLVKVEGVDVNRGAQLGLFSLHHAAFSGMEEVTEILVENGADLNITTPEGFTALEAAVCAGNFECAEILIKNGAPVDSIKDGFVDRSFCNFVGGNSVSA
ncbi:uncharacterized protein LOC114536584 [Dendronephthya gigantea]|uniref:uncharacterized protein LOC114536584 n=1 Tax=Dendronephthya gigantea TaxID=151771 RepID=UPI001069B104|nr:uncharacterized protein LOC114536584 [Dendronephthya gigantea]